jgi:salicylate hydroxylase
MKLVLERLLFSRGASVPFGQALAVVGDLDARSSGDQAAGTGRSECRNRSGLTWATTLLCERRASSESLVLGFNRARCHAWFLQSVGMLQGSADYAARPTHIELFHGHQASALARLDLGSASVRRHEAPDLTLHRADLQTCLVERLKSVGQTDLRMGSALVGFHQGGEGVDKSSGGAKV